MRKLLLPACSLLVFVIVIAFDGFGAFSSLELPPLRQIGSAAGVMRFARVVALWLGLRLFTFAVLGALAVWCGRAATERAAKALALAALLALVSTLVALALAGGSPPTLVRAAVPLSGALLGWALAGAFVARGRARLYPLLIALVVAVTPTALCGWALVSGVSREAALPLPPELASAERRALIEQFRGRDPRKIPEGETRTVTLSAGQVDALVRWLADAGLRTRATVALHAGGFSGALSAPLPRSARWLNLRGASDVSLDKGRITVAHSELSVGTFQVPSWIVTRVLTSALDELQANRDVTTILGTLSELTIDERGASVRYGRLAGERGLFARLVWGEESDQALRDAVLAYVPPIVAALEAAAPGDARFSSAMVAAFTHAKERSAHASALAENRHAFVALGIVLGHRALLRVVSGRLEGDVAARVEELRAGTTLRTRADWTRHFSVSAALTVLSDVAPSDAVSLLKEQLDADGGSGFSFGDLLADRAGTTLAERATRSEDDARRVQAELASGFDVARYMPDAAGLPEGLPEAEFKARFGGVQDARYRALADDIERRIGALPKP